MVTWNLQDQPPGAASQRSMAASESLALVAHTESTSKFSQNGLWTCEQITDRLAGGEGWVPFHCPLRNVGRVGGERWGTIENM